MQIGGGGGGKLQLFGGEVEHFGGGGGGGEASPALPPLDETLGIELDIVVSVKVNSHYAPHLSNFVMCHTETN